MGIIRENGVERDFLRDSLYRQGDQVIAKKIGGATKCNTDLLPWYFIMCSCLPFAPGYLVPLLCAPGSPLPWFPLLSTPFYFSALRARA